MPSFAFDDRNIEWKRLAGAEHLWLSVLDIDESNGLIHVLYKFAGNEKILLHRHKTLNKTFVIQGEHRLYHPNGEIKEMRPVGSYKVSPPSPDPHREGGGDKDVIVFFTIYGGKDTLYEILDDDLNVVAPLTVEDFRALM
ncbi:MULTISPECIES: hypothetical protein [Methylosinus]|uniref:Regulator n=1 Tax=Methylosinus trichosporium (strain ATCC 35070 / NCIMB 11131 / UNIQEM 75 / OB3b) TaxID=595536 RepID=A0A2D2D4C6_METT3|nr:MULTISPECIES: hypothetical protein [Methylosinus]ATQ69814.1 regulator [Methylosinus trichosporium OB3b]OBS52388.1 regulator [Methylosinus sp. 3S-1]